MAFLRLRGSCRPLAVLSLLLVGAAALLTGCHKTITDSQDPNFIVANQGDNWSITRGDLNNEVDTYLKQRQVSQAQVGPSKMAILETAMLRNIVVKKLLLAKAATMQIKDADVDKEVSAEYDKLKGATSDADFDQQLKAVGVTTTDLRTRLHEKVLIQDVLAAQTTNIDPTEQEIDEIYMKYKDSFNIPAKVRASRVLILVDDKTSAADKATKKKAIDNARQRVIQGEDFSKVAMDVSEDKYSAPKGGDIGSFQRNENEPGFDDVAFNTKVGAISPVFVTALGYQFIKVTAIQPAGTVPIADARNVIAAKLREMKTQQEGQAYAQKLMADSNVNYHIVLVDPPAQPAPTSSPAQPTATGDASTAAPAPGSAPASMPAPDASTNAPVGAAH